MSQFIGWTGAIQRTTERTTFMRVPMADQDDEIILSELSDEDLMFALVFGPLDVWG